MKSHASTISQSSASSPSPTSSRTKLHSKSTSTSISINFQFNQLLASLLIPITIPLNQNSVQNQQFKLPSKLLLKVFESLLEMRFDSLTTPIASTSKSSATPNSLKANKEEEFGILLFLDQALSELFVEEGSRLDEGKSTVERIVIGLIMLGEEMGLITITPTPLTPSPTSTTSKLNSNSNHFFPITHSVHSVLTEIQNEQQTSNTSNGSLDSGTDSVRSPSKVELRNRGLINQLERIRLEDEENIKKGKWKEKERDVPILFKPIARRVDRTLENNQDHQYSNSSNVVSPQPLLPLNYSRRNLDFSTDYIKHHFNTTSPSISNNRTKTRKNSLQPQHDTFFSSSQQSQQPTLRSHSSNLKPSIRASTSNVKDYNQSGYLSLVGESEIEQFENEKVGLKVNNQTREQSRLRKTTQDAVRSTGRESGRVAVVDVREGWEWTKVTGREKLKDNVVVEVEEEEVEYERALEKEKARLIKILNRLKSKSKSTESK